MTTYEIFYSAHFNWYHTVCKAVGLLASEFDIEEENVNEVRFKDLPTIQSYLVSSHLSKVRPNYSLFRVEVKIVGTSSSIVNIHSTWADSQAFSFLDAKDSLFQELERQNLQDLMPKTILIPWDVKTEDQLTVILNSDVLPHPNNLLKSAVGSGGSALYFVNTLSDVLEVVKSHANRAMQFEGFIDGLKKSNNGKVPSWSIQRLISPVYSLKHSCKTQVRVYVVKCMNSLYICNSFEVRLPYWDNTSTCLEEFNSSSRSDNVNLQRSDIESILVGEGCAIPYNEGRNKSETQRFHLDEIDDLSGSYMAIHTVVSTAFKALATPIQINDDNESNQYDFHRNNQFKTNRIAVAGIDVVVEIACKSTSDLHDKHIRNGFRAYIIEVNSNPALASPDKRMSDKYKAHLDNFIYGIVKLGLNASVDSYNESAIFDIDGNQLFTKLS